MSLPRDEAGYRELDARCANPNSADSNRLVALLSANAPHYGNFLILCVDWSLSNLVRCALAAGVSPDSRCEHLANMPVLVQAAGRGCSCIVKQLLEAGADHRLVDGDGFSALSWAAKEGHLDCIKLLLDAGADANIGNVLLGYAPLITAIMHYHRECAEALLPASDLSITDCQGHTAFHVCILSANEECFDLLLPHVSDVDVRTVQAEPISDGQEPEAFNCSPLLLACMQGQHRMAKALLKRGADRMARDNAQRTPLFWAAQGGHLACVVLLLGHPGRFKMTPAEVNATSELGGTGLHFAAYKGFEKICGVLVEAGAQLDLKTSVGWTPLMIAKNGHPTNAALHALLSGNGPAQLPGTVCDQCGKTAAQASVNNLKACSQCQAVRYCGAECSAAAWQGHKAACKARAAELEEATKPMIVNKPAASQL